MIFGYLLCINLYNQIISAMNTIAGFRAFFVNFLGNTIKLINWVSQLEKSTLLPCYFYLKILVVVIL